MFIFSELIEVLGWNSNTSSPVCSQKCDFCTIAKEAAKGVKWYRSREHELSDRWCI